MYLQYYLMGIILLPGILLGIYAQSRVNNAFSQYSRIKARIGITAGELIRRFARQSDMEYLTINQINGQLTDNFNPRDKSRNLSSSVYNSTSIAALGVACHEFGHAMQQKQSYTPYVIRRVAIPITNIASTLLWPLVIIGLLLNVLVYESGSIIGDIFLWSGIGFFGLSVLINLITLPVEFNASNRALRLLEDSGTLNSEELDGAKEVLKSAALTYVAALVVSILSLLRFLLYVLTIRRRR